jgi:uncharacterized protein with PIN domain
LICKKCNEELVLEKVYLEYLDHRVSHDFLVCPKCGNLYIPEDITEGKMADLEKWLEDK